MDIRKRLLRRPLVTILWILVLTAMAMELWLGSTLLYSSEKLLEALDRQYTTVALRTDRELESMESEAGTFSSWIPENKILLPEDIAFLKDLPYVKDVYFHSLTGGYSPSSYYRVVVFNVPLQGHMLHCKGCCGLVCSSYHKMVSERLQPQPFAVLLIS